MYLNDMANLILILSCIHVHVGIYVILGFSVITCTFCWPLGSGVAFYSSRFGQHDHLDAVKPNQIFWGESQLSSPHSVHVLL